MKACAYRWAFSVCVDAFTCVCVWFSVQAKVCFFSSVSTQYPSAAELSINLSAPQPTISPFLFLLADLISALLVSHLSFSLNPSFIHVRCHVITPNYAPFLIPTLDFLDWFTENSHWEKHMFQLRPFPPLLGAMGGICWGQCNCSTLDQCSFASLAAVAHSPLPPHQTQSSHASFIRKVKRSSATLGPCNLWAKAAPSHCPLWFMLPPVCLQTWPWVGWLRRSEDWVSRQYKDRYRMTTGVCGGGLSCMTDSLSYSFYFNASWIADICLPNSYSGYWAVLQVYKRVFFFFKYSLTVKWM